MPYGKSEKGRKVVKSDEKGRFYPFFDRKIDENRRFSRVYFFVFLRKKAIFWKMGKSRVKKRGFFGGIYFLKL